MTYFLGIDIGTTFSSAAIVREGRAEAVVLGHGSATVPSVVWMGPEGETLVGDAAARRGQRDPSRLAREFKRRFGDEVPLILGGTPVSADQLTVALLGSLYEQVIEREGGEPERVAITHPANWGEFRRDMLAETARAAGLSDAVLLTEPEAAALHYATTGRVDDGEIIIVYDLGGGTFDVAILRRAGDAFELVGEPDGVERLGGIDFDRAVIEFVRSSLEGEPLPDGSDDEGREALLRLQAECVAAKEALTDESETDVTVAFPGLHTRVRLTRREFEEMVRPTLFRTTEAVRRALDSAGIDAGDASRVLLIGGSSRVPLVAELVGAELGREVAVDAHPKMAVPLGAAVAAASGGTIPEDLAASAPVEEPAAEPVVDDADAASAASAAPSRSRRTPLVIAAVVAAVLVAGIAAVVFSSGGDSDPDDSASGSADDGAGDASGGATSVSTIGVGSTPQGITEVDGDAWVSTADGDVLQVSGSEQEVVVRVPVAAGVDELASAGERLLAASTDETAVVHVINTSTGVAEGRIDVEGQAEGVAVDDTGAYVSGVTDLGGYIATLDLESMTAQPLAEFESTIDEIVISGDVLWAIERQGELLHRVDRATGAAASFELDSQPSGMAVGEDAIWVTLPLIDAVARVDPGTGETVELVSTPPRPDEVATGGGLVWVTLDSSGKVAVVDPATDAVVDTIDVGDDPDAIAYGTGTDSIWVANRGEASVSLIEIAPG